jgi:hypothetical protein
LFIFIAPAKIEDDVDIVLAATLSPPITVGEHSEAAVVIRPEKIARRFRAATSGCRRRAAPEKGRARHSCLLVVQEFGGGQRRRADRTDKIFPPHSRGTR